MPDTTPAPVTMLEQLLDQAIGSAGHYTVEREDTSRWTVRAAREASAVRVYVNALSDEAKAARSIADNLETFLADASKQPGWRVGWTDRLTDLINKARYAQHVTDAAENTE